VPSFAVGSQISAENLPEVYDKVNRPWGQLVRTHIIAALVVFLSTIGHPVLAKTFAQPRPAIPRGKSDIAK
jgi:hypothetical protein